MNDIAALGWLLGFATMFVNTVFGFIYLSKLTNVLKSRHPIVWDSLGRPVPFCNSIQTSLMLRKFVNSPASYVQDEEVFKLAGTLKIIKRIQFIAFAIVIICSIGIANSPKHS
jgi:hypothetical protein